MAKKSKNQEMNDKLHPIEASFNEAMLEFRDFKNEQMEKYTQDGQSIDMASFEQHFKMMFLFGKLREIEKLVKGEKTDGKEATGKGSKGNSGKGSTEPSSDNGVKLGL